MSQAYCCESCGMKLEVGRYCRYCVDESGQLQGFELRFERMVQWVLGEDASLSREQAQAQTLAYMAGMPAWAQHPRVLAAASKANHGA